MIAAPLPRRSLRFLSRHVRPVPATLAVFVAVGAIGYAVSYAMPVKLHGAVVTSGQFTETVSGIGTLTAESRTLLAAPVQAVLLGIDVAAGTPVERGATIARFDARAVEADWRSAEAKAEAARRSRESAEAALAKAHASAADAATRLERIETLTRSGHATEADRDSAATVSKTADLDIRSAEAVQAAAIADEAAARATADELSARLADYTLKAPFAGIVSSVPATAHTLVSPGNPIAEIVDPSTLSADIRLDESSMAKVAAGAPASLRILATGETAAGHVIVVDRSLDTETREGRVRVRLDKAPSGWAMGQRVTASIVATTVPDATVAPLVALAWDNRSPYVLADRAGRARRLPVEVLAYGDGAVQLKGVAPGTRLLPPGSVRPGRRVEVLP